LSGASPQTVEIDGPRRAFITVSVMLASIMSSLDTTIANVALPRIQGSVSATQDQMAWVLTSYIVAAAIMTPLSGWLAGQIGRKKVFLYSVAGFTVASMLCGAAQSLPQIVLARLVQGLCGAALIPLSQAVLLDINPPARHARAMAVWVMGATLGPIIGPALGGWLTENYNWRWVFYINVPLGILAFLGIMSSLPEAVIRKSRFDFFGFTALSVAIASFQIMLDRGQLKDWFSSTEIWVEATVAGVMFYLFMIHMLTTTGQRFVSLALFKDRNFLTGNLFIFIVGAVLYATLALLPPLLLSVTRTPWTYFTFNPWLKRLPEYLTSPVPWAEKLGFLSRVALFWFSADGPYGQPEWGFAVDGADVVRFLLTAALVGVYVALWLDRRAVGVSGWRAGSGRAGGTLAAAASVLGLSTGPCSVVGCGAPVLPVVALVFAGLSSTTLALLSEVSRISAIAVVIGLLVAITWLGWRAGARPSS